MSESDEIAAKSGARDAGHESASRGNALPPLAVVEASLLARVGPSSPAEWVALLQEDQIARWQAGERVPAEEYLRVHASREPLGDEAFNLIYTELVLRQHLGERPSTDEYVQRFPQFADQLRRQMEIDQAFDARSRIVAAAEQTLNSGLRSADTLRIRPSGSEWPNVPGYQIVAELGRGGMGVVYEARQLQLNRSVALKMIRTEAEPDQLARFRREAEAVARLQHPNIVQIHEVGETAGRPYLVLEHVAGGSLAQHLAGMPQPPRHAARLVETLARAVQFAHTHGVVHRDLKPANVLLSFNGEPQATANLFSLMPSDPNAVACGSPLKESIPKLTDFGLAKTLDGDSGQTQSQAVIGTPSYMAPEQALGRHDQVGPATDVYALGAILYEMLSGRPPFKAATAVETLLHVREQEPVSPRRLQTETPRDLETICLKCLQKQPHRRYASAESLADDLRRFQAGEPIAARRAGPAERVWKWARRRPAVATSLTVAALAVLGVFAVGMAFQSRLREADRRLQTALLSTEQREARATSDRQVDPAPGGRSRNSGQYADIAKQLSLPDGFKQSGEAIRRWFSPSLPADTVPQQNFLDQTFGNGGRVFTTIYGPGNTQDFGRDAVLQPDGKIVVAGIYEVGNGETNTAVVRVTASGALDPTFGRGGIATFNLAAMDEMVQAVALQSDGKIVLTGSTRETVEGYPKFMVVRLKADGSLDERFGFGGKSNAASSADGVANDVAIQRDGRIVVVGTSAGPKPLVVVQRFSPDGVLDRQFGEKGIIRASVGIAGNAVAIQSDGKIVVAGSTGSQFLALRFHSTGAPDYDFDGEGVAAHSIGDRYAQAATAVAIQPDGKIVLAGYYRHSERTTTDAGIVRLNMNGSYDATFGFLGYSIFEPGPHLECSDQWDDVAIQPDGKILVAGRTNVNGQYDFLSARYHSDGRIDESYWPHIVSKLPGLNDSAQSLLLQPDGKFVLAGNLSPGTADEDFAIVRCTPNGDYDSSFGGGGVATFNISSQLGLMNVLATDVTVQDDGKLVSVGSVRRGAGDQAVFVSRHHPDGTNDSSFGSDGTAVTPLGAGDDFANAVVLQPDGKIVVAGQTPNPSNGTSDILVLRYLADGTLDSSFGSSGLATIDFEADDDVAHALVLDGDRIIVAGSTTVGSDSNFAVARLTADGGLDTSFGVEGLAGFDFGGIERAKDLALDNSGRIVIAGTSGNAGDFAMMRLLPDGDLDPSFGQNGAATLNTGGTTHDSGEAVAIQADGKIWVAGQVESQFALARFNDDGTIDDSFNGAGWRAYQHAPESEGIARAVVIDPDGAIVLAGHQVKKTDGLLTVLRIHAADGRLDTSFANNGFATVSTVGVAEGLGLAQDADGRIIACSSALCIAGRVPNRMRSLLVRIDR